MLNERPSSIVFVRHAQTDWNTEGTTMGQIDVPASEDGLNSARFEIQKYSRKHPWIVSSPLKRARITAQLFAHKMGVDVCYDLRWIERHWGRYQGQPKASRPEGSQEDGVESSEDFLARVALGLKNLPTEGEGMIVSHSGVFKALIQLGYQAGGDFQSIPHSRPIVLKLAA